MTDLNVRPRLSVVIDGFFKLNEAATCRALRDVGVNVAHAQIVAQVPVDIASPLCVAAAGVRVPRSSHRDGRSVLARSYSSSCG